MRRCKTGLCPAGTFASMHAVARHRQNCFKMQQVDYPAGRGREVQDYQRTSLPSGNRVDMQEHGDTGGVVKPGAPEINTERHIRAQAVNRKIMQQMCSIDAQYPVDCDVCSG